MKKLYKKSTVHPSPPPPPPPISDHLSLLPAAIFTLTLTLSTQDKEVLAYLLSSSTTKKPTTTTTTSDHPPLFHCSCFRCYMSYWVRWDSSPNRQLIHEIIDALEDGILRNKKDKITKKDRKKKLHLVVKRVDSVASDSSSSNNEDFTRSTESNELTQSLEVSQESAAEYRSGGGGGDGDGEEEGPVRKFVSFLGERIWSVWT